MSEAEFDLCGPLPTGVTVLEASAGTGKTYTIAALAARYVAEGKPLERMLIITFTRMATGELRDRVRERLVSCEEQLSRTLAGDTPADADEVVRLLATGTTEEVTARRNHLVRAIADFDAATIATTHGFCQEMLAELGTVGDLEPGTTFVEDVSDLLEEVLDDLYVRRFQKRGGAPFDRAQALRIARAAVANPAIDLEPHDAEPQSTAAMRWRLATKVREELELRKRRQAIMTYDDLLTRLNDILKGPSGEAAKARLRARYDVVLVDEFQDTDPIQWQILRRSFKTEDVTLVLIADPKQAIYAFRGADVYAYLVAAEEATARATLQVNRRSDQALLDAYDALFGDARLGHPGIVYRRSRAAAAHERSRLTGAPAQEAMRIRVVERSRIETTEKGYAKAQPAREHVARDLAGDIVRLLASGAELEERDTDGRAVRRTPLQAGDVAVLVRTRVHADLVRTELEAARVPVVINGAGSVFATSAARDWVRLLDAIDQPASTGRARAAALTPFIGWSAVQVATATEADWDDVHRRLHRWSRVLREDGVAELTETIMIGEDLPCRTLGRTDGERQLTDVRHIAQLLHGAATADRLGATALRGWLAQRIEAAELEEGEEERTRRLESDAEAVQVLTIHRSKGLEFPVVYCPFLWQPSYIPDEAEPVSFHDPERGDRLTVDVGLDGSSFRAHQRQRRIEQRGEDLRLAYVALTRAKHQAVVWWAGSWDSRHSPLGRLLFNVDKHGNVAPEGNSNPEDGAVVARLNTLAELAQGSVSVERAVLGTPEAFSPPLEEAARLEAARFERELDLGWRRTSYSDITAVAHDPLVASEPEEPALQDEPEAAAPVPESDLAPQLTLGLDAPSPLAPMPTGVQFGTFVHRVLESCDFAARDLPGEVGEQVAARLARRAIELGDARVLTDGLVAALETPLGSVVGGIRLRDVARSERLDELEFELPLAGGDEPTGRLTLKAIAGVLREGLAAGDPLAAYASRLEDPQLRTSVRGFLTGSIDLVVRLAGPRFAIVDYKTNWLGAVDEELTLGAYQPRALAAEMSRAHYGLQALLYTVALHRYLRWRLPGYSAHTHLAGVLYLFVRGMAGADTPLVDGAPCGVFAWRPPGPLVEALSDVLDHGAAA